LPIISVIEAQRQAVGFIDKKYMAIVVEAYNRSFRLFSTSSKKPSTALLIIETKFFVFTLKLCQVK
jgi:hypothetical protein